MSELKNKHILLVDDDKKSSPYLIEELMDTYFANVTWLSKADDVLDKLSNNTFDAVLFDIMMPIPKAWDAEDRYRSEKGLSTGIILFNKIRNKFPKLPVVILTGKTEVNIDENEYTKLRRKPEFASVIVETLKNLL